MNLELIKKLTKLANNNPNDNEANLAARKVCKLLEEGNFSLTQTNTTPTPSNRPQSYGNPFTEDIFDAIYGRGSRGPGKSRTAYDKVREEQNKQQYDPRKRETKYREDYYDYVEYDEKIYNRPFSNVQYDEKGQRKSKLKRILKCKECKQNQETGFVGLPELYVCDKCQWTAFRKGKEKDANT